MRGDNGVRVLGGLGGKDGLIQIYSIIISDLKVEGYILVMY